MTSPYCGRPEAPDSLTKLGQFGFCTVKKLNVITKVLADYNELKLCFLPLTVDCKCDRKLLYC